MNQHRVLVTVILPTPAEPPGEPLLGEQIQSGDSSTTDDSQQKPPA
jgi:hypothetical protein